MKRTALIVEDDLLIAMELEDILERLGFRVIGTAVTETQAVAATLRHRPDLLLADYRLAQGDGVSAVERIETALAVSVVFVTANGDELRRLRPGAVLVDKPFDSRRIEQAVHAVLDSSGDVSVTE